jgi:hypothetical protein
MGLMGQRPPITVTARDPKTGERPGRPARLTTHIDPERNRAPDIGDNFPRADNPLGTE